MQRGGGHCKARQTYCLVPVAKSRILRLSVVFKGLLNPLWQRATGFGQACGKASCRNALKPQHNGLSRPLLRGATPAFGSPSSSSRHLRLAFPAKHISIMQPILSVSRLSKTYATGRAALEDISLDIEHGEIFALLGPNGAGKTTLISILCGIVQPSAGSAQASGHDIVKDYRRARSLIGLVPQELTTDAFETVWATVTFSRGLFGKSPNPAHIEKVLRALSLWDRKDSKIMTLSGGMKRRVMIAKALSHEPQILFLDEPTAGVDVELRRDMWRLVSTLRDEGVTIILTTHYLEEAEEMADRIGVINKGKLILVEDKRTLMSKLGKKQLTLLLETPLAQIPGELAQYQLTLSGGGTELVYTYDTSGGAAGVNPLLRDLALANIAFKDLRTTQSSLEDIFVNLVRQTP
jgi:ABC-2 type transport system ATP-binding protein